MKPKYYTHLKHIFIGLVEVKQASDSYTTINITMRAIKFFPKDPPQTKFQLPNMFDS
jgi:hypothetical protein